MQWPLIMSLHLSKVTVTDFLPSPSLTAPFVASPGHPGVLRDCGGQTSTGSAEAGQYWPPPSSGGGVVGGETIEDSSLFRLLQLLSQAGDSIHRQPI